jgi:curli biogenesis system outer membrane secretion channel CsgG
LIREKIEKMKRLIFTLTVVSSLVILTGCSGSGIGGALSDTVGAITGKVNAGTDVSGRTSPESDYTGNRANIAVLRFTDATGGRATGYRWWSREVGDSMARKLTSSLLATKRFRIVQRKNMSELMDEINFGASGAVAAGSASQFGKMIGARLIVTASITDFEDSGGSKGGAGSRSKGLLGVLGGSKRTYMAINLEVVDVQTSEIIASEQIDATVRDVNFGALLGSKSGSAIAGVGGWDKEPKGKALTKIINSAVQYLEQSVPSRYYTEPPV